MRENTPRGEGAGGPASLVAAVRGWALSENLIRRGDRVLVAVSGGTDSLALLHILAALRGELELALAVASFDHGLRGAEGAADVAYVEAVSRGLGLTFHAGKAETPAGGHRPSGLSPEDWARRARYHFLGRVAREWGPGPCGPVRVATGHTADDQAETVLMRIVEGTGLDGLVGIPAVRQEDGWVVVRPLLRVWRRQTRDYCAQVGLTPREDPTNLDQRYRRNLIRNRILPALREYNPRVEDALIRLAELACDGAASLRRETDAMGLAVVSRGIPDGEGPFWGLDIEGDIISIERAGYLDLPDRVKKALLRRLVAELAGDETVRDVGFAGLERAAEAIGHLDVGGRLDLPSGVILEAGYGYAFLAKVKASGYGTAKRLASPTGERGPAVTRLVVPGVTELPETGWVFDVSLVPAHGGRLPAGTGAGPDHVLYVDPGSVRQPLRVRARRPGDSIRPVGLGGTKKLKDLFISLKVPKADRDSWPLVVDAEDRIVWVTGLRADERFAVPEGPGGEGPLPSREPESPPRELLRIKAYRSREKWTGSRRDES